MLEFFMHANSIATTTIYKQQEVNTSLRQLVKEKICFHILVEYDTMIGSHYDLLTSGLVATCLSMASSISVTCQEYLTGGLLGR